MIGLDAEISLIKMYLPSGSTRESDRWKSTCLEMKMDTPLVQEPGFVACNSVRYTWLVSLGMASERKCVS